MRDGAGAVVPDALVEIWQANAAGRYAHPDDHQSKPLDPNFSGYGRAPTDDEGRFAIETVMPGRVPGPDDTLQAPHLLLGILARGILTRLVTRVYFDDEPSTADDADPRSSCPPIGARRSSRGTRAATITDSTWCCRAIARRCSSMSECAR